MSSSWLGASSGGCVQVRTCRSSSASGPDDGLLSSRRSWAWKMDVLLPSARAWWTANSISRTTASPSSSASSTCRTRSCHGGRRAGAGHNCSSLSRKSCKTRSSWSDGPVLATVFHWTKSARSRAGTCTKLAWFVSSPTMPTRSPPRRRTTRARAFSTADRAEHPSRWALGMAYWQMLPMPR